MSSPSTSSTVVYRALVGAAVAGGWIAAWVWPRAPILSWWIFCGIAFGAWLAFSRSVQSLGSRAARLVLLHAALLPSALGSTQCAARQVSAASHLRYHGVLIEQSRRVVIGSGIDSADVVFPMLSRAQVPWRIELRRGNDGWSVDPASDAEQIRFSPLRGVSPTALQRVATQLRLKSGPFAVANAALLVPEAPRVVVRTRSGTVVDTLTLASDSGRLELRGARLGAIRLDPVNPRFAARYRRALGAGTVLASLDGERNSGWTLPLDRLLRIEELAPSRHVNGHWSPSLPFFGARRRFLLSASAPLTVQSLASDAPSLPHAIGDSTRVEVRHGGGLWRFDVVGMQREQVADSGLAVRFVTTPRVMDVALPVSGDCASGVACGVLSLRPLPPPVAHVSLDGAGLDSSRYALLAKLRPSGRGYTVALGQQEISVMPGAGLAAIPVDSIETEDGLPRAPAARATRFLLLSAANNSISHTRQLALVAFGLVVLLLFLYELVQTKEIRARGGEGTEKALALGLSAVLTLLTTRVVLGARVTFFPPENPAGIDTAIGMFVAIAIAAHGLTRWERWVPAVLTAARLLVPDERAAARTAWADLRTAARRRGEPGRRRRHARSLLVLFALGLLSLGFVSPTAVLMGFAAGALVLSVWLLMAWIGAFSGSAFHDYGVTPCDVVEHDSGGARSIARDPLVRVCLQWALILWSPLAGLALSGVLFIADLGFVLRARSRDRSDAARRFLVFLASVAATAVIALMKLRSENGAMAAFLLVILVTLTSVRMGRVLASQLQRQNEARGEPATDLTPATAHPALEEHPSRLVSVWRVVRYLLVPLLLLAPLALIDMGLLLVTVIPIGFASVLAVGRRRLALQAQLVAAGFAVALVAVLVFKVLSPPLGAITSPRASHVARADAFDRLQGFLGLELVPPIRTSLERTAARAVATRDQVAAERLLVAARPGNARDLLIPSIEQVWGGRVYSASGLAGHGQGTAPTRGHGIAEAVSYAENSFAVYVMYEHGALGGAGLIFVYLVFTFAVLVTVHSSISWKMREGTRTESLGASRALFLVAALLVAIPAAYVSLSNTGVVPITGQNIPFMGLNAWSDVTLAAGVCGMLLAAAIRVYSVQRRTA